LKVRSIREKLLDQEPIGVKSVLELFWKIELKCERRKGGRGQGGATMLYLLYGYQPTRKRFRVECIALFLACAVASVGYSADRSEWRPSQNQTTDLDSIAASRPCAATALLYVFGFGRDDHGAMELDGLPSRLSVEMLLDAKGKDSPLRDGAVLQRSPYSSARVFTKVEWSLTYIGMDSYVLTTRAELVMRDGSFIEPRYYIEAPTSILVSGDSMGFID